MTDETEWNRLAEDAESILLKAKARVRDLKLSISIFRDNARCGVPFPSYIHDAQHQPTNMSLPIEK
jgi:hypothetical protein